MSRLSRQSDETPEQEIQRLKQQIRLMALAISTATDRADQQQKILEMHETRLTALEKLARGQNEQN